MTASNPNTNPRVVIIGGGFGGLQMAKSLHKKPFEVTVVDRHNYHTFQPLLYQVATGGLEADSIAYPLRKVFRNMDNVHVRWAEVDHIDTGAKVLRTTLDDIPYDKLVIATGSTERYFNFDKNLLLTMKTVPDALNLRSYILQNFEKAVTEADPGYREELINIALVGGGPTGLELSGALGEMKKYILPLDYPELDLSRMNIVLFQAGDRLLPTMSEYASRKALDYLRELGVEVRLDDRVVSYDGDLLTTETGYSLRTDSVIWTAGVKANFPDGLPEEATKTGRIAVNVFNEVIGVPDVYAVGDVCEMTTPDVPQGYPMLAPVAIQQGQQLAANLVRERVSEPRKPFSYWDKGTMATVGRNRAVVDINKIHYAGFIAWISWMVVHVVLLVGFRNKFAAVFDWTINYFTFDTPMRLIVRPFRPKGVGNTPPQRGDGTTNRQTLSAESTVPG